MDEGPRPLRSWFATTESASPPKAAAKFVEDKHVGSFATGEEQPKKFGDDERLGSFARGEEETESSQNVKEGTFGGEDEANEQ